MIAFQSSKYNGLSLQDELIFTINSNIEYFDIFFDGFLPNDLAKRQYKALQKSKLKFSVHAPIENYTTYSKTLSSIINFCNEIEAFSLTIHFDKLNYETIKTIIKYLNPTTKLSIENTIPNYNKTYSFDYEKFIEKFLFHSNFFLTFDIGHYFITNKKPLDFIKKYIGKISTFHIHNNDGIHDNHLPVNAGKINYSQILKFLKKENYNGLFVIEHWNNNIISANLIKQIIFTI